MIAITNYATKSFSHGLPAQPGLVLQNLRLANLAPADCVFILAGDDSAEVARGFAAYTTVLTKAGVKCERLTLPVEERKGEHHNTDGNLIIATLQDAAWGAARLHGADLCWSLESDILPPANALRTMRSALDFDGGWYDVVMATYPNTAFLGGHGDPAHWIAPNAGEDERQLSEEHLKLIAARDARLKEGTPLNEAEQNAFASLAADIEKQPPVGNVFERNAKHGWRPRGWFEEAYPAIGLGALVPTQWVGLGCTLMSRRALDLAQFTGYGGHGTQDLWLCWRVWHPYGLRLAVTSHAVCSHIKPHGSGAPAGDQPAKDGAAWQLHYARHELGGPAHGHLRQEVVPWIPPKDNPKADKRR
jgi:hypothetical protein